MKFTFTAILALVAALAATSLASSIPRSGSWRHSTGLTNDPPGFQLFWEKAKLLALCIRDNGPKDSVTALEILFGILGEEHLKEVGGKYYLSHGDVLSPCLDQADCPLDKLLPLANPIFDDTLNHEAVPAGDHQGYKDHAINCMFTGLACLQPSSPFAVTAVKTNTVRHSRQQRQHRFDFESIIKEQWPCVESKADEDDVKNTLELLALVTKEYVYTVAAQHAQANSEDLKKCGWDISCLKIEIEEIFDAAVEDCVKHENVPEEEEVRDRYRKSAKAIFRAAVNCFFGGEAPRKTNHRHSTIKTKTFHQPRSFSWRNFHTCLEGKVPEIAYNELGKLFFNVIGLENFLKLWNEHAANNAIVESCLSGQGCTGFSTVIQDFVPKCLSHQNVDPTRVLEYEGYFSSVVQFADECATKASTPSKKNLLTSIIKTVQPNFNLEDHWPYLVDVNSCLEKTAPESWTPLRDVVLNDIGLDKFIEILVKHATAHSSVVVPCMGDRHEQCQHDDLVTVFLGFRNECLSQENVDQDRVPDYVTYITDCFERGHVCFHSA